MSKYNHMQAPFPPRIADRLLEWFCAPHLVEEVQGDLHELYGKWVEKHGVKKARWLYFFHALKFFRPYAFKKVSIPNPTDMFKNYFTIAWRNMNKHKSFAFINISGLTLGITCALVIFLMVRFEYSFDNFHHKADRIYRVMSGKPGEELDTGTPTGLMNILEKEFPEVEQVAVAFKLNPERTQIEVNHALNREPEIYFTTPSFFDMFDFKWIQGSPETSLAQPGQVVIDEALAQKYFQGEAMGKQMKLNNEYDLTVSGIIQKAPENTDFPMQIAVSHSTLERTDNYQQKYENSTNSYYQTYVLLREGADPKAMEAKFPGMVKKYLGEEIAEKYLTHALQPLSDIHFAYNFTKNTASKTTLSSLGLIAVFLLLTACINFVNLATAQAVRRSKEVGIRKVLGSTRRHLIAQFLGETFLITLVSFALSLLFAWLALPYLQTYFDIPLDFTSVFQPAELLLILAVIILVSLLAGYYPALVLSAFQPIRTLATSLANRQSGGLFLRRALVVFQFAIAQLLIICTLVVVQQTHYFNTASLGFDKEAIVEVDVPESNAQKLQTIGHGLLQDAAIMNVSFSLNTPAATINKWWSSYTYHTAPDEFKMAEQKFIDENYLAMYHITLLAGRNVKESDTTQILVNEALLKDIGIRNPQDALGETLNYWNGATIVGVIRDFHSLALQEKIPPLILWRNPAFFQKASVKINMSRAQQAIAEIARQWKQAFPRYYFTYKFLDDDLATFYEQERKTSRMLSLFAGMAIFIGCLGLYGLISFVTAQKTKEVGIRKVLGATVQHIVYLFTKDFLLLIGIAFLLAAPIGYYLMQQWLADFAYRIEIRWWMFVLPAMAGLLIAAFTISFKSVKAALANPVDSLRNE